MTFLNQEQIEHYKTNGWVVVPIFSEAEIHSMRADYHDFLQEYGVIPGKLDRKTQHQLPTGNTPHLNVYYARYKLRFSLDERVWHAMSELWAATYASGEEPGFEHTSGPFDPEEGLVHIDRACFRFPQSVLGKGKKGGELRLHVDKNPRYPNTELWRPVQMSLALVDHDGSGTDGGLGLISGFHLEFDDYFAQHPIPHSHRSQFVPMKRAEHRELWDRIEFIKHPAGSIVLWDNRLPHCTAPINDRKRGEAREVFFSSFLPNTYPNDIHARSQLEALKANVIPPQFAGSMGRKSQIADAVPLSSYGLTSLQRKLLGIEPWPHRCTENEK